MTARTPILVFALTLALAGQAFAAEPDRRPAAQTVFTGQASCLLTPLDSKESALSRCFIAAKINLLDKASAELIKSYRGIAPNLVQDDYRAIVSGLITPQVDSQDFTDTGEKAVATIRLRAAADPDKLTAKVKDVAANPVLRQKLADSQRTADAKDKNDLDKASAAAQVDSAQNEAYADFSKSAQARRKILGRMHATADEAALNIRKGMSNTDVREVLGEPATVKLGTVVGNFTCLGYGEVWVVLEDGVVSCLRSRLQYVKYYDSECQCAGMLTTFIPFANDPQTGPAPRKGHNGDAKSGKKP